MIRVFALTLAATLPAHAEMCKAPNAPRAVLQSSVAANEALVCPAEGFCWRLSPYTGPAYVAVVCLSPLDIRAAMERNAAVWRGESPEKDR